MKAFHQGQLDYFCAIYAVLNALRICHDIRPRDAGRIMARTLKQLSTAELYWHATLDNSTDFHWLPLWMLGSVSRQFPLRVRRPFALNGEAESWQLPRDQVSPFNRLALNLRQDRADKAVPPALLADTIRQWLDNGMFRSVLLRFHRYLSFKGEPLVSHWSAGLEVRGDTLALLDASKEDNALHDLPLNNFCTTTTGLGGLPGRECLIRIEPDSVYLLERAG